MSKLALSVGDEVLHVESTVSSTVTGRRHYLRADGRELWRVQGNVVAHELPRRERPAPTSMDYKGSICMNCGKRKPRKGGRNIAHLFVCSDCVSA